MMRLSKVFRKAAGLLLAAVVLTGGIRVFAEELHLQWQDEGGKAYWY